jgi:hypothetical protein
VFERTRGIHREFIDWFAPSSKQRRLLEHHRSRSTVPADRRISLVIYVSQGFLICFLHPLIAERKVNLFSNPRAFKRDTDIGKAMLVYLPYRRLRHCSLYGYINYQTNVVKQCYRVGNPCVHSTFSFARNDFELGFLRYCNHSACRRSLFRNSRLKQRRCISIFFMSCHSRYV